MTCKSTMIEGGTEEKKNEQASGAAGACALPTNHPPRATHAAGGRAGAAAQGGHFRIEWDPSHADVFLTKPGPFVELVSGAIAEVTGRRPELSTTGGTSDPRFIKDYCPVVEFGLVNTTMNKIDENVATDDLVALTAIYRRVLDRYFDCPI